MQINDVVMVFNGKAAGMYCEVVGVTEKRISVKSRMLDKPVHISKKNYIKMVGDNLPQLLERCYV